MSDVIDNAIRDPTKRKVVTPKVNAYMYRAGRLTGLTETKKGVMSLINMRDVGDLRSKQDSIKGLEHEQTALFGGVLDLNIGTDPQNKIFDSMMPDDHIEVFYEDMAKPDTEGRFPLPQSYGIDTSDTGVPETDPKFSGVVWKEELIEKPSQVTTKVKAWDYHRMMQYMNIPRGVSGSTAVTYINVNPFTKRIGKDGEIDPPIPLSGTRKMLDISPHNDLLDYIDHVVDIYLKEGNKEHSVFFFPTKVDAKRGQPSNTFTLQKTKNPLGLQAFTLSGIVTNTKNPAIKIKNMHDDYPLMKELKIGEDLRNSLTFNDTTLEKAIARIEGGVSGQQQMSITRFMDTSVQVSNGFEKIGDRVESVGPVYRVIGEIVSIDQFALAKLLAAGMTYDYGISEWFTPVPIFGPAYMKAIAAAIESGSDGVQSSSRLTYVRWYAGSRGTSGADVTHLHPLSDMSSRMRRVAVFNLDSFGNLVDYFSRAININLQAMSISKILGTNVAQSAAFIGGPHFIPIVLAAVEFPQKLSSQSGGIGGIYRFYAMGTKSRNLHFQDVIEKIAENTNIDLGGGEGESFRNLMVYHLRNISSWTSVMTEAFRLDDKLISFMTNIPSAYMRADIYTGSRFKTYAYDSLSIIRVLQILTSTMKGYPATNNPVHSGNQAVPEGASEKIVKVNHYPIFLANRIVVTSKTFWVPFNKVKESDDPDVLLEYTGTTSVSASFDAKAGSQTGRLFIVLEVDFKRQVYDEAKVEFKIPLGDINDLSVVKGASQSHHITLSFGEHARFLRGLTDDNNLMLPISKLSLAYNMGGKLRRSVAPAEFSPLTLTDMTQNDTYDPLIARSVMNGNILVRDGAGGFPVYHPGIAYTQLTPRPGADKFNLGSFVISDWKTRTSSKVVGGTIRDAERFGDNQYTKGLVSVENYVDFTDIINELKLLRRFADPTTVTAAYIDIEQSDKALFDNIVLLTPYVLKKVVDGDGNISFRMVPPEDSKTISLTEFLQSDVISEFIKIEPAEMAWLTPIRGHWLGYDSGEWVFPSSGPVAGKANAIEVEYESDKDEGPFDDFRQMYLVIAYLDLLIKGLRYMMWTISKSRFLGHVYLPINYSGYIGAASPGDNMSPGSSILFYMEDDNVRSKTISTGLIHELFGRSDTEVIIQGQDQHQLQSVRVLDPEGETTNKTLIWYVSKKIVYIGEDSGAMMRLNMTEGSFDWTIFYREDTQMTRMSEFFLMNGMGSFFLGRGGE